MAPVALVTGCSSGVGLALSVQLAAAGWRVWATMRDTAKGKDLEEQASKAGVSDNVNIAQLDVQDQASVAKCFESLIEKEGALNLLVNNAGYSLFGSLEMVTDEQCHQMFETNFFGVLRCTRAALPQMRMQKSGKIIYVTSVGGIWGQPFNDVYCASKFALEGLAESQAALFREFGVYVTCVEPGGIKSAFIQNAVKPDLATVPQEYHGPIQLTMQAYQKGTAAQTPDEVAQVIVDQVVKVDTPPLRVQTSERVVGLAKMQFADTTGEAGVATGKKYFLTPSTA
eukprot:TRINITY_DN52416_c0_g1_i1.p1 TRINITY_DN52416_c0_g1~~TRINITY_DN52416_c0_g1_i1.p1  ORF type:complete len:284 (+),score=109.03 TRINITY_DN52416_c0_g1_i1:98-949(+)